MSRSARGSTAADPDRVRRLIEAARAGDGAALNELLSLHLGRLSREARRRVRGAPGLRPSDLVQDTAERAVRSFKTFQGNTDPEVQSWLLTILQNLLVSHHRKRSRLKRGSAQQIETIEDLSDELPAGGESPSQALAGKRSFRALLGAVFELPPAQREAVHRFLRGATVPEIAGALGRTNAAVSCLLQRATKTLQSKLGGADLPPPRRLRVWLTEMRAVLDGDDDAL